MTPTAITRLSWGVLALPLALEFLVVSIAMWPQVLQNNVGGLALIAFVIASPLLPLVWRSKRVGLTLCVGGVALILQVVAIGFLNSWF